MSPSFPVAPVERHQHFERPSAAAHLTPLRPAQLDSPRGQRLGPIDSCAASAAMLTTSATEPPIWAICTGFSSPTTSGPMTLPPFFKQKTAYEILAECSPG